MTDSNSLDTPSGAASHDALRILELFAEGSQIAFDRVRAGRVLSEAERAIPGSDAVAWSRRLVEVGESLNLRVRSIEATLDDMLSLAWQGIPVATCLEHEGERVRWLLITEVRGRRARVADLTGEGVDDWYNLRRLRKTLGLRAATDQRRWVVGQAAFGCARLRSPRRIRTPVSTAQWTMAQLTTAHTNPSRLWLASWGSSAPRSTTSG